MAKVMDRFLPALALALVAWGAYTALVVAPPERMMGDVYRILFVHVPSAWMALIAYTVCLVASLVYLFKERWGADALAEASAEVGVLFNATLLVTGSLWGRPTWGVFWTWDPRLTSAAIMFFAFSGYLALRHFVDSPERRASWAAVAAIIIYVDIPIVWYSVKWWNSLHQVQSSPQTVDPSMVFPLRLNAIAFLAVLIWFVRWRYRLGMKRQADELTEPPLQAAPAQGDAS